MARNTTKTDDDQAGEEQGAVAAPPTKQVMLLGDHVYLPADPTQPDWRESTETIRYEGEVDGRRARVAVHAELADFLQERKQAEILDA
jgi:hypothetical protein